MMQVVIDYLQGSDDNVGIAFSAIFPMAESFRSPRILTCVARGVRGGRACSLYGSLISKSRLYVPELDSKDAH